MSDKHETFEIPARGRPKKKDPPDEQNHQKNLFSNNKNTNNYNQPVNIAEMINAGYVSSQYDDLTNSNVCNLFKTNNFNWQGNTGTSQKEKYKIIPMREDMETDAQIERRKNLNYTHNFSKLGTGNYDENKKSIVKDNIKGSNIYDEKPCSYKINEYTEKSMVKDNIKSSNIYDEKPCSYKINEYTENTIQNDIEGNVYTQFNSIDRNNEELGYVNEPKEHAKFKAYATLNHEKLNEDESDSVVLQIPFENAKTYESQNFNLPHGINFNTQQDDIEDDATLYSQKLNLTHKSNVDFEKNAYESAGIHEPQNINVIQDNKFGIQQDAYDNVKKYESQNINKLNESKFSFQQNAYDNVKKYESQNINKSNESKISLQQNAYENVNRNYSNNQNVSITYDRNDTNLNSNTDINNKSINFEPVDKNIYILDNEVHTQFKNIKIDQPFKKYDFFKNNEIATDAYEKRNKNGESFTTENYNNYTKNLNHNFNNNLSDNYNDTDIISHDNNQENNYNNNQENNYNNNQENNFINNNNYKYNNNSRNNFNSNILSGGYNNLVTNDHNNNNSAIQIENYSNTIDNGIRHEVNDIHTNISENNLGYRLNNNPSNNFENNYNNSHENNVSNSFENNIENEYGNNFGNDVGNIQSNNLGNNYSKYVSNKLLNNVGNNIENNLGNNLSDNVGNSYPNNFGNILNKRFGNNLFNRFGNNLEGNLSNNCGSNIENNINNNLGNNVKSNNFGNKLGNNLSKSQYILNEYINFTKANKTSINKQNDNFNCNKMVTNQNSFQVNHNNMPNMNHMQYKNLNTLQNNQRQEYGNNFLMQKSPMGYFTPEETPKYPNVPVIPQQQFHDYNPINPSSLQNIEESRYRMLEYAMPNNISSEHFMSTNPWMNRKKRKNNPLLWQYIKQNQDQYPGLIPPSNFSNIDYVQGQKMYIGTMKRQSLQPEKIITNHTILPLFLNCSSFYDNNMSGSEFKKISKAFNKRIENIDYENITVQQLKCLMKEFGLNHTGKKNELISRVKETAYKIREKMKELENNGSTILCPVTSMSSFIDTKPEGKPPESISDKEDKRNDSKNTLKQNIEENPNIDKDHFEWLFF